jgi:hypothetical protein
MAEQATTLMKSRRRIACPEAQDYTNNDRLHQGFATGEMGFRGRLHSSNLEPLMSALGQKLTSEHVRIMSALPPKADIGTQPRDVRFVPKADILSSKL